MSVFVLVDRRQPPNLELLHVPYRLGDVIVLTATMISAVIMSRALAARASRSEKHQR